MEDLFQTALGIASPWFIESVKFNTEQSRLDIYVNFQKGSTFRDSIEDDPSGKAYTAFDTVKKTWRHLNFFQHECYLHARVPRIKRDDGRVRLIPPPWSGKLSGFTLLFEAFLIQMCRSMPIHHVSKITGVSDYRLWRLLELYVNASRFDEDYSRLHTLGMDETSATKGHDYITLFVDLEEKKTLFVADGKSSDTVKAFTEGLKEHNGKPEQVKQVSCDMSPAFIKGVREELPSAEITFDKFHIIKIINEAVDKVRREEAKTNPLLKGAKYILLKNESNLTAKQKTHRESLSLPGLNLKSIRALNLCQPLIQLVGKLLAITLAQCRRPAGFNTTGAKCIHEVTHVQPCPNIVFCEQFTARTQRSSTFFNHFGGQRNIAGDNQVSGLGSFNNLIVCHIKAGGDLQGFYKA